MISLFEHIWTKIECDSISFVSNQALGLTSNMNFFTHELEEQLLEIVAPVHDTHGK